MNRLAYILLFILISMPCVFAIEDNFVNSSLGPKNIEPPIVQEEYNYQDTTRIPVKLSILNEIKSEKDIQEGQILEFKVVENVIYRHEKLVSKGSLATARVETIINNGMNGIPASVKALD